MGAVVTVRADTFAAIANDGFVAADEVGEEVDGVGGVGGEGPPGGCSREEEEVGWTLRVGGIGRIVRG